MVIRLLCAGNGTDAVVGVAGAGKSTLMDVCRIAWDAIGITYADACLSAAGAQGLQEASAIPSRTVAAWLQRIDSGEGLTGVDVLVVDEATMTADRSAARLLTEAARTGTQVIAIGDPLQLQAVGIGGWFHEAHRLVDGLALDENRRRHDAAERAALEVWRTGDHQAGLELLADGGRVHAVETAGEARAEMLMAWDELRHQWPDDCRRRGSSCPTHPRDGRSRPPAARCRPRRGEGGRRRRCRDEWGPSRSSAPGRTSGSGFGRSTPPRTSGRSRTGPTTSPNSAAKRPSSGPSPYRPPAQSRGSGRSL
ncbi:AAA family ATPase [Streptomyces chilikensis]|uniref:AAA family ATPase n=1 Tax=Streptomyces chilikensis TaxID=1194079 RepID=UPI001F0FFD98|nr:AAA family ATPase [Streptomyces chilikensis]